jgi:hypothetical protein
MLMASIIDEIRWLRHDYKQMNSKNAGTAPGPVPRPGVKATKKRAKMTLAQAMILDPRMRGGNGG